ncbi:MAG: hypothetical protein D6736_05045, partial [Nitrospinota bacterium]
MGIFAFLQRRFRKKRPAATPLSSLETEGGEDPLLPFFVRRRSVRVSVSRRIPVTLLPDELGGYIVN